MEKFVNSIEELRALYPGLKTIYGSGYAIAAPHIKIVPGDAWSRDRWDYITVYPEGDGGYMSGKPKYYYRMKKTF